MIKDFFTQFEQEGSQVALDNIYATNKWMALNQEAIDQLKQQVAGLTEDYVGKYYGYELVAEKRLGKSFVLKSFMLRFDRQPIRFSFQFYKPNDTWVLHSFKFDGNLDDELEEAAKLSHGGSN